ncbi:hypothetical protein BKA93DRAFT_522130 [Sparassis latifolia]
MITKKYSMTRHASPRNPSHESETIMACPKVTGGFDRRALAVARTAIPAADATALHPMCLVCPLSVPAVPIPELDGKWSYHPVHHRDRDGIHGLCGVHRTACRGPWLLQAEIYTIHWTINKRTIGRRSPTIEPYNFPRSVSSIPSKFDASSTLHS